MNAILTIGAVTIVVLLAMIAYDRISKGTKKSTQN